MKIEFTLNTFYDGEWWFDLGVFYSKTNYHRNYRKVFSIGLGIATIYIRW